MSLQHQSSGQPELTPTREREHRHRERDRERDRDRDYDRDRKKHHKSSHKSHKHRKHRRDRSRSRSSDSYDSRQKKHKKHKRRHRDSRSKSGSRSPSHRGYRSPRRKHYSPQSRYDMRSSDPQRSSHKDDQKDTPSNWMNFGTEAFPKTGGQADIDMERDWQQATAKGQYIFFPNRPPYKRKGKNKWTDANQEEIARQLISDKVENLDTSNPALMINQNPELIQNLNPTVLNALQDSSKIKKKIYIPQNNGVNYIGMLIGPKGLYQKRLEEESGCKILIRGKGSQKQGAAPQPDDDDEQHVLVIGDNTEFVRRAQTAVERIITADDITREKIRHEQLVVAQQLNNSQVNTQLTPMDDSMMTPYGAPSPYAYTIPVPNDAVGLIIGKNGETIRRLQNESGARIQVAKMEIKDSNMRNVFVEGSHEKYLIAKEQIDIVIAEHRRANDTKIFIGESNPFGQKATRKVDVADKYVGLVIGKQSETLKGIAVQTQTRIFMPQKNSGIPALNDGVRVVEIIGDEQDCIEAESRIMELIHSHQERQAAKEKGDYSAMKSVGINRAYTPNGDGSNRQNRQGMQKSLSSFHNNQGLVDANQAFGGNSYRNPYSAGYGQTQAQTATSNNYQGGFARSQENSNQMSQNIRAPQTQNQNAYDQASGDQAAYANAALQYQQQQQNEQAQVQYSEADYAAYYQQYYGAQGANQQDYYTQSAQYYQQQQQAYYNQGEQPKDGEKDPHQAYLEQWQQYYQYYGAQAAQQHYQNHQSAQPQQDYQRNDNQQAPSQNNQNQGDKD